MDHPDERPRIKCMLDFDSPSPLTSALNREMARQASSILTSVFSESGSNVVSAASSLDSVDYKIRAVFDDVDSGDSGQPLLLLQSASRAEPQKKGSGITRSKTQQTTLSPTWTPMRAASARAVLCRRQSSRFEIPLNEKWAKRQQDPTLIIPGDQDASSDSLAEDLGLSQTRSVSMNSISAKIGAMAVEKKKQNLPQSRSSQFVQEELSRSMSGLRLSPSAELLSEAERIERAAAAVELIEYKFRKHMNCSEAEDGYKCMCTKYCTAKGVIYTERYGCLGNALFIRGGYYDPGHLVELFIDAYDENKRIKDEEKERVRKRHEDGYAQ